MYHVNVSDLNRIDEDLFHVVADVSSGTLLPLTAFSCPIALKQLVNAVLSSKTINLLNPTDDKSPETGEIRKIK